MLQSTLCYLERGGAYLMLHRVKKEQDANRDPSVPCHRVVDRFGGTKSCFDLYGPGAAGHPRKARDLSVGGHGPGGDMANDVIKALKNKTAHGQASCFQGQ